MAVFKCKMCGGTLEITSNESIATCEYCGTQQTLPKLDDEKRASILDRANHFRRNNEFDKAAGIYEQLLEEDGTDAEVYWSLVLCRYGIEYVEDPNSHKRVPTVNRAQLTSIFDDSNYKLALQYADSYQKGIYENEATAINEIQKGILAISQKEEPFDIFICYKETDNNGRRTMDSVLAQDMYNQLTEAGFKVFFSRITLEDKLGTAYEPYIFAALNSSKVMIAVGTKPEHFNAVWVKNEWSRYLALIKEGKKKTLIPAYKEMDPYDLPYEFSHLQAQDMSKLGYMQDIIRGIKKLVGVTQQKPTVGGVEPANTNDALLKRGSMFLEDSIWNKADEYFERVLDIDPENAEAYVGKLLVDLKVKKFSDLGELDFTFDENPNYAKIIRYADDDIKGELSISLNRVRERVENKRVNAIYSEAIEIMNSAQNEDTFVKAARLFETILDFKDSKELLDKCKNNAEEARKDAILKEAEKYYNYNSINGYKKTVELLQEIPGWKNANTLLDDCKKNIHEIEKKEAKKEKGVQKTFKLMLILILIFAIGAATFVFVINPSNMKKDFINQFGEEYVDKIDFEKGIPYITLGEYEQDGDDSNGKEPIEWRVLDIKDGNALLVSKYILDNKSFSETITSELSGHEEYATWETSTIRLWLNDYFYNESFDNTEKSIINITRVSQSQEESLNPNVLPYNPTEDFIFILDEGEALKYFKDRSERTFEATAYAEKLSGTSLMSVMLRTVGTYRYSYLAGHENEIYYGIKCIYHDGRIPETFREGSWLDSKDGIVPAMWIDLDKLQ